jgi:hypothetical protein
MARTILVALGVSFSEKVLRRLQRPLILRKPTLTGEPHA